MKDLKIVFYGTPEFAVHQLDYLYQQKCIIVAVVTAPDKPSGRGKKIKISAVKKYALTKQLPLLQPTNLKAPSFQEAIEERNPDCQVVVAFRMLPKNIWSLSRLGTINLHASLLPNYRGAAPINWVIKNGERHSGLTTFLIDEQIDTGAMLLQEKIELYPEETAGSLHDRLAALGGPLLYNTIVQLDAGELQPQVQQLQGNEKMAPKLDKANMRIDWKEPLPSIAQHIRAMSPYPGAWTVFIDPKGSEEILKIFSAKIKIEKHHLPPHQLFIRDREMLITTPEGYLICEEVQLPNKRKMTASAILNGYTFDKNTRIY